MPTNGWMDAVGRLNGGKSGLPPGASGGSGGAPPTKRFGPVGPVTTTPNQGLRTSIEGAPPVDDGMMRAFANGDPRTPLGPNGQPVIGAGRTPGAGEQAYWDQMPHNQAGTPTLAAKYQDSYQVLLDALKGGASNMDLNQLILERFKGTGMDLEGFMNTPMYRQIAAFAPKNSDVYKQLSSVQDPTRGQINVGLGQISQATSQGVSQALQAMNSQGMGRNVGAMQGMAMSGRIQGGAQGAQYRAAMEQAAYQNEVARLGTLMDLEQQMTQLALGYSPQPRQPSNKAGVGDWLALAGSIAGAVATYGATAPTVAQNAQNVASKS